MHEIIEDNFLGPWPRLVLPCPLNFHVRGCDHLAVTCSLTLHAYVKRCLPMTNGERTGYRNLRSTTRTPIDSTSFCAKKSAKASRKATMNLYFRLTYDESITPKSHILIPMIDYILLSEIIQSFKRWRNYTLDR